MSKIVWTLLCCLFVALVSSAEISQLIWDRAAEASVERPLSVIVVLKEQTDFSRISPVFLSHSELGQLIFDNLKATAQSSQSSLISALSARKDLKVVKSFFVVNALVVDITSVSALEWLESSVSQIAAVEPNMPFRVRLEEPGYPRDSPESFLVQSNFPSAQSERFTGDEDSSDAAQWNIKWVKADQVWQLNYEGEGFIYANADTGVFWKHETLADNYLGNGKEINHNYAWWDGVKKPLVDRAGPCGINSQEPCDDHGHGTHTTSTSVGGKGYGVAPKARWVACRNMDQGMGSSESYLSCLEFFLAPTDLQGNNPNVTLRPHAIGNSYGCPQNEGCAKTAFSKAVQALRAASIFMSVSAGNDGPFCKTIDTPPAFEPSVITVGALGKQTTNIASYSSRGPFSFNGTVIRKPDVCAPGSLVKAAFPPNRIGGKPSARNNYATLSGTSMASPHVGAAAILISDACPCMERDIDALQNLLQETAHHYTSQQCGSDGAEIPNNVYGYGGIDILAAVNKCQKICDP